MENQDDQSQPIKKLEESSSQEEINTTSDKKKRKKFRITKHWALDALLAAIIGLLVTELWFGLRSLNPFYREIITNEKPMLIGIYPKDAFGKDQKAGLVMGVNRYGSSFDLIHLDYLTLNQMKSNDISLYTDSLKTLLAKKNVFSIIGPSVTESSLSVIKAVEKSKRKVPIFLLTAASKKTLQWENKRKKIPLFRICTDIDLRASKITGFIKKLTDQDQKVGLLVEISENIKTYGDGFLATIESSYGSVLFQAGIKKNKISIKKFDRANFQNKIDSFKDFFYQNDIILLLGTGNQFKIFLDKFYTNDSDPKAHFGGWLNSYAYNDELTSGKYVSDKIFEITDFNINAYSFSNPVENISYYINQGRKIIPPDRDFALGYDAGYLISKSYSSLTHNKDEYLDFNRFTIDKLEEKINEGEKGNIWKGVTGEIDFSKNGENSRDIKYVKYTEGRWRELINIEELINIKEQDSLFTSD